MVLIILTISVVSVASYLVATSALRESLRIAREEMESGGGRHRYVAVTSDRFSTRHSAWQHANNNCPVTSRV